jgi:RNA polymerase sigma-70 factor (ECF subfamily)
MQSNTLYARRRPSARRPSAAIIAASQFVDRGPAAGSRHQPGHDDLVAGFRAGRPDAVQAVYQRYARPVATVARSVVGNDQAMIDDIVQQTFAKAWQAAARFDDTRELAPWLYTIARRTAIDHVRAERRPDRSDQRPETKLEAATASDSLERTWEAFEVRRAVGRLPADEREIVRLSHLLGLTHHEIAERLHVPVGTVKSRSHRAHRRLTSALAHLRSARQVKTDET